MAECTEREAFDEAQQTLRQILADRTQFAPPPFCEARHRLELLDGTRQAMMTSLP